MSKWIRSPWRWALCTWGVVGLVLAALAAAAWNGHRSSPGSARSSSSGERSVRPAQAELANVSEFASLATAVAQRAGGAEALMPLSWRAHLVYQEPLPSVPAPVIRPIGEVVVMQGPNGLVALVDGEHVREGSPLAQGGVVKLLTQRRLVVQYPSGVATELDLAARPSAMGSAVEK